MNYYVYILKCRDGSYYTGITPDIEKRMQVHQSGGGSKYVASRRPFHLVYQETCISKSAALKREIVIKNMNHRQKHLLIAGIANEQ